LTDYSENPTKDSYVDQAVPNNNYGNSTNLYVMSYRAGTDFSNKRTFVGFDISSIPANAIVDSATLKMYCAYIGEGRTVQVHRVTGAWDEGTPIPPTGITWNNQPAVTSTNYMEQLAGIAWQSFNVKNMVQDAIGNSEVGFRLKDKVENSLTAYQQTYRSRESPTGLYPYLEISYHVPEVAKKPVGDGLTFAI